MRLKKDYQVDIPLVTFLDDVIDRLPFGVQDQERRLVEGCKGWFHDEIGTVVSTCQGTSGFVH